MDETKLTVRVTRSVLENAKRYASEHGTTLTRLVNAHLDRYPEDMMRKVMHYNAARVYHLD